MNVIKKIVITVGLAALVALLPIKNMIAATTLEQYTQQIQRAQAAHTAELEAQYEKNRNNAEMELRQEILRSLPRATIIIPAEKITPVPTTTTTTIISKEPVVPVTETPISQENGNKQTTA